MDSFYGPFNTGDSVLSFALFAGVLAPFDPLESHYADMLKAPNSTYIFGTDQLGRDLFSRILYGGKSSLLIAFTVTAIILPWEFWSVRSRDSPAVF